MFYAIASWVCVFCGWMKGWRYQREVGGVQWQSTSSDKLKRNCKSDQNLDHPWQKVGELQSTMEQTTYLSTL